MSTGLSGKSQPTGRTKGTSIFDEKIKMIEGGNEIASFDVANASDEQRQEFLKRCIQAYHDTIETEKIVWSALQQYMIELLKISKRNFGASKWRPLLKTYAEDHKVKVVWKS